MTKVVTKIAGSTVLKSNVAWRMNCAVPTGAACRYCQLSTRKLNASKPHQTTAELANRRTTFGHPDRSKDVPRRATSIPSAVTIYPSHKGKKLQSLQG